MPEALQRGKKEIIIHFKYILLVLKGCNMVSLDYISLKQTLKEEIPDDFLHPILASN